MLSIGVRRRPKTRLCYTYKTTQGQVRTTTRPAAQGMDQRAAASHQSRGQGGVCCRDMRACELWPEVIIDLDLFFLLLTLLFLPLLFQHTLLTKLVLYLTSSSISSRSINSNSILIHQPNQPLHHFTPTNPSNHVCSHRNHPAPQQGRFGHRRHPGLADREQDQAPQDEQHRQRRLQHQRSR